MYFDYAATTPPNEEVLKTFEAVNRDFWANPRSLYQPGARSEQLLEQARNQVQTLLGANRGYRCVFTSGATESNNMAIKGVAHHCRDRGRHIVTSSVEHASVLEVCRYVQAEGWELDVLPVNRAGVVDPDDLQKALRPDTVLVSLMHVNNETGSINDIARLGSIVKEKSNAAFHVDAAQSVGKLALSLAGSPVDLLTFSAHKFFGLKGAGALILRDGVQVRPLLHGGGQEFDLRSGTADVARAVAMARALRISLENTEEVRSRVEIFKASIADAFNAIPDTVLNGTLDGSSPFIINYSISGVRPETLLQALGEKGIYISTVSACSTRKTDESHVVYALTGSHERAKSSIRISLSALTTQEEIDVLCSTLGPVIESLRFKRK